MKRFNHMYALAFAMVSTDPTGEHVSAQDVRNAVLKRLASLTDVELVKEAVGLPLDTYEEEPTAEVITP